MNLINMTMRRILPIANHLKKIQTTMMVMMIPLHPRLMKMVMLRSSSLNAVMYRRAPELVRVGYSPECLLGVTASPQPDCSSRLMTAREIQTGTPTSHPSMCLLITHQSNIHLLLSSVHPGKPLPRRASHLSLLK